MLTQTASRLLLPAVRSAIQSRFQSGISGPPTKHVPKEIYALIVTMVGTVFIYPCFILFNIPYYRDLKK